VTARCCAQCWRYCRLCLLGSFGGSLVGAAAGYLAADEIGAVFGNYAGAALGVWLTARGGRENV